VSGAKNYTSLADYCTRTKTNQSEIYFVTGSKLSEMKKLPYVESVKKRGYEVVYMNEPADEYLVQTMNTYTPPGSEKSFTLKNIAKNGLSFSDETDDEKQKLKDAADKFKPLMDYLQKKFSSEIEKVTISNLLESSPMAVVSSSFGWSPEMKKMMKGNKNDPMAQFFGSQKEILEINPNHSIITYLLEKVSALPEKEHLSAELDNHVTILFNAALLHSGYDTKNPHAFARLVEEMIREKYGMEPKPQEENVDDEPDVDEDPAFPDFSSMMGGDSGKLDGFDDLSMPSEPEPLSQPEPTNEGEKLEL